VGEIDIDAVRIKDLALKLERQSFAYQQMVVFGAPARSRQVGVGISSGSSGPLAEPFQRSARPSERILHYKLKVFARYKKCQAISLFNQGILAVCIIQNQIEEYWRSKMEKPKQAGKRRKTRRRKKDERCSYVIEAQHWSMKFSLSLNDLPKFLSGTYLESLNLEIRGIIREPSKYADNQVDLKFLGDRSIISRIAEREEPETVTGRIFSL
jgi:hypothetical protein